jgi:hypothetical protein
MNKYKNLENYFIENSKVVTVKNLFKEISNMSENFIETNIQLIFDYYKEFSIDFSLLSFYCERIFTKLYERNLLHLVKTTNFTIYEIFELICSYGQADFIVKKSILELYNYKFVADILYPHNKIEKYSECLFLRDFSQVDKHYKDCAIIQNLFSAFYTSINVKGEYVYFIPTDCPFYTELKQKISEILN